MVVWVVEVRFDLQQDLVPSIPLIMFFPSKIMDTSNFVQVIQKIEITYLVHNKTWQSSLHILNIFLTDSN